MHAQHIAPNDYKRLKSMEETMYPFSRQMVLSQEPTTRFYSDSVFIKLLVQCLKVPHSFYYTFDSVNTISKLYAPDSSFRIFTWQLQMDESYYRQYGAIQINMPDGSLKLFPLTDVSEFTPVPTDTVRTPKNWIGAIYYKIIPVVFGDKKYYTLFGLDDNDFASTKKWIEVLSFDDKDTPIFGGKFFEYKEDAMKPLQPAYRFCIEFKKDANARLVYDQERKMIVFDHLISESSEPAKKYTLIPYGTFEGFKWTNGKWLHVPNLFPQDK